MDALGSLRIGSLADLPYAKHGDAKHMTLKSGTFAGRTPTNPNKLAEIGF